MKKSMFLCATLVLSSTLTMRAQQVSTGTVDVQGARGAAPTGQVRERRLATPIGGQVVKGAPYSAEIVTESVQTFADGNRIVHRTTGRVYRDGEGRVRREEDQASGLPSVSITDPVAGKSFTLNPVNRTARETLGFGTAELRQYLGAWEPAGVYGLGYSWVQLQPFGYAYAGDRRVVRGGGNAPNEEKLSERTIEGVRASGVRRTTTIPAGAIGNERPIAIVSEEWTSSELQILVLTDLSDPRAGRSTYKLLKINRAEPDPALFRVPGDYAVERLPAPGRRGGLTSTR